MVETDGPTYGERLEATRRERGLTGSAVAQHLGISLSYLRDIEKGNRQPSRRLTALIHEAFGIPSERRDDYYEKAVRDAYLMYHALQNVRASLEDGKVSDVVEGERERLLGIIRVVLADAE
jgi:transcriptional regulator with XRE-family HTH domain